MASQSHLTRLKAGAKHWNRWRAQHRTVKPDLVGAELTDARLAGADLRDADLSEANLREADLHSANLSGANLRDACLRQSNLQKADLRAARLSNADLALSDLSGADLRKANLTGALMLAANLSGADLREAALNAANLNRTNFKKADLRNAKILSATLVRANLTQANLDGAWVYGVSAWNVELNGAIQSNLIITPPDQDAPPIQVDNLEVAQFIFLLLNNQRIRDVIDTITSKVVLILGRFNAERKVVLDAIRDELRRRGYTPILFDFEKPASRDLTGTITTLANMARFIIADLTEPSSVPHELASLVPSTVVPVQPIILQGRREYAMFADLMHRYEWVLEPYHYKSKKVLLAHLGDKVIAPAEAKAKQQSEKATAQPAAFPKARDFGRRSRATRRSSSPTRRGRAPGIVRR